MDEHENKIIGVPSITNISIDKLKERDIFGVAVISEADTPSALMAEIKEVQQAISDGFPALMLSRFLGIESAPETIGKVVSAIGLKLQLTGESFTTEVFRRELLHVCKDFVAFHMISLTFVNSSQITQSKDREAIINEYVQALISAWEKTHGLLDEQHRTELIQEICQLIVTRPFTHNISVETISTMSSLMVSSVVKRLNLTNIEAISCFAQIISSLLVCDQRKMEQYVLWTKTEQKLRRKIQCPCSQHCEDLECTICGTTTDSEE